MSLNFDPGTFKSLDANPGGTLELLSKYVDRIKLIFDLAFCKADGTSYTPSDKDKKAMLLFRDGNDMKTFDAAVKKFEDGLKAQTNNVVQRNLLLANYPQGSKSFDRWYKEVSNGAKIINYDNYDWKQLLWMQYCCRRQTLSCGNEPSKRILLTSPFSLWALQKSNL